VDAGAKNKKLIDLRNLIMGRPPMFLHLAAGWAQQWVAANTQMLKDMNREQLSEGVYSNSEPIQDGYSDIWGMQRMINGRQIVYVDLNYTGDFYRSIAVTPVYKGVLFSHTDDKIGKTRLRGGSKVKFGRGGALGLTQENANVVGGMMAQVIRDKLMKHLLG
jgi:hypothetical protein